ncbi:MAG TPA: HlyD family efflux transporter periplasmic adaptor subunit [Gemmatimonadaceae bacterium]|nr:HlyD family efflux transporter periplasmic adaptor subunit [Gemmatimonadaceae bacterium]
MRTRTFVTSAAVLVMFSACRDKNQPDAYGNFETTEVVVSAETSGQLLWFKADEGQPLTHGQLVGVIDTTQLSLQERQLGAQRSAGASRVAEVGQQLDALRVQHEIAGRNYERVKRLFAEQAATAQQLDQAERDYKVLGEQVQGAEAQQRSAGEDVKSTDARLAQISQQLAKTRITSPVAGTVLARYTDRGEFVQPGQPLYKIANLDSMILRAYVNETQLARVKLGAPVTVSIDTGSKARRTLAGTVTWVSPEAEFTPTPIQTRDERKDLVYAVKVRVPNPGGIVKIGMPADVRF